ncbi:PorP/SprF family type IX secretion system membrane protein [Psychroflexus salis]|uniref:Membrane protein n=1 Tax=Psychroflexus salis TaxID=1526574 RepID=A0A916ZPT6_9FLAO|nr:type IX secretion system membrane protein PorP/SprF [Psychroflexus salis]GGE08072.1 membrane protein [Psychroflexus salis]
MKLIKTIVLVLLFIVCSTKSFAQERGIPVYQDYLTDNLYLIHPSMAGASNQNKARLTARQQWFDVDNPPSLQTLSVNGRLNDKVGVGAILFNDSNGRYSQQGGYLSFAYHLMFSRSTADLHMLSFGTNIGIIQSGLNETDLVDAGAFDPIISGVDQSEAFFNADFGFSYFFMDWFSHVTVKNIVNQENQTFTDQFQIINQRQYLATLGYNFNTFGSPFSFEPSVMFHHREATEETNFDINGKAYYEFDNGMLWGGLSYRRSLDGAEFLGSNSQARSQKLQTLSPFVGVNYGNFMFAYTYTNSALQEITISNSGFHQITLGYNFGENRGRYKCNCPAVNW